MNDKNIPSVLDNIPSVLDSRKFWYMGVEWMPVGLSSKIAAPSDREMEYEFNRKGEVRRKQKDGSYKAIILSGRMFQFDTVKNIKGERKRRYVYVPKNGEICVGNGEVAYRFDTLREARSITGTHVMVGYTVDGWTCERGWPQPYFVGDNHRREWFEYPDPEDLITKLNEYNKNV